MAVHSFLVVFIVLSCCFRSFCHGSSNILADAPSAPQILDTNPFRENLRKNISFDDPLLRQALWKGIEQQEPAAPKFVRNRVIEYSLRGRTSKLSKRAPGALIQFPQCLSCAKRAATVGPVTIGQFSTQQLIAKMSLFATLGSCLFYSQRPPGSNPRSLSGQAQAYSCSHVFQYRSIWDLWPYDPDTCAEDENYYCLNPYKDPSDADYPCCWLNPLLNGATNTEQRVDKAMAYFQIMSEAMALTCTGNAYILTENIATINQQIPGERASIWLTKELPTLQGLYQKGVVTNLIAITGGLNNWNTQVDVSNYLVTGTNNPKREMPEPTEFTLEVAKAIMRKRKELLDAGYSLHNLTDTLHHQLGKRDCGGASKFEDPNGDYFG